MINPELVKLGHKYKFGKVLGQGGFASVYLGTRKNDNLTVALKCIDLDKHINKETNINIKLLKKKYFESQPAILQMLDSPNIIRCYDVIENDNWKIIVLQYCQDGNLLNLIKQIMFIPEIEAVQIIQQLIKAFALLHKSKIIHRDLKSQNILIHKGVYKIADFGLAKTKQLITRQSSATSVGTIFSMAPQVLNTQAYGLQAEMWSLGVIYYQMLVGYTPFTKDYHDISIKLLYDDIDYRNISEQSKTFLKSVFVIDPKKRLKWIQFYKFYNEKTGIFKNSNKHLNHYFEKQTLKQESISTQKPKPKQKQKQKQKQQFYAFKKVKQEQPPLIQNPTVLSKNTVQPQYNKNQINNQEELIATMKTNHRKINFPLKKEEQKIDQNHRQQRKLQNNFKVVKQIYENTIKKIGNHINQKKIKKHSDYSRSVFYFLIIIDTQILKIIQQNKIFLFEDASEEEIKFLSENNTVVQEINVLKRKIIEYTMIHKKTMNQMFHQNKLLSYFSSDVFTKKYYLQLLQKYIDNKECKQQEYIKQTQRAFSNIIQLAPNDSKQFLNGIEIFMQNDYLTKITNRIK